MSGRRAYTVSPAGLLLLLLLSAGSAAAQFDLRAALETAPPGGTIRVPAGRYAGPLSVDRPVTLIADGEAIIDGGRQGVVLRITAPDVTLCGFTVQGSGDSMADEHAGIIVSAPRATLVGNVLRDVLLGIVLRDGHGTRLIENRVTGKPLDLGRRGDGIRLWNSHDCRIERNHVRQTRDVVIWYSSGAQLVGNEVCQGRYGLHFMYAHDSVLVGNRVHDNSVGVFLMYSRGIVLRGNVMSGSRGTSGYGLGLKDMDDFVIEDNLFASNRVGVFADNAPQRVDRFGQFRRNVFAFNDTAVAFLPSVRRNRFAGNAFIENLSQVAVLGGGELQDNDFTPDGQGNYWSDYAGYDADGDGVGDVPYGALSLFENLMDREPKLRLFLFSPAQQAIDLAARAFPIMQPRPKIADSAPQMRPAALATVPAQAPHGATELSGGGLGWPGVWGVLGAAAALWGWLRAVRDPGTQTVAPAARPFEQSDPSLHPAHQERDGNAAPGPAALVALRDVRKHFGRFAAVADLTLDVAPGEALALWGANGAGKTTIIKCILGLHHYRGSIQIGGCDALRQGKSARRLIGYVAQEQAFYDDLTTAETVRLFARLKRVPADRAASALARVDLAEHRHKRVGQLSGGMKQRLALAVALLADPPLLLLDEPTSNLDAAARRHFHSLLLELKGAGKTIVFTTHRSEEVDQLADRVVLLERGRITRVGPPSQLAEVIGGLMRLRIELPSPLHDDAQRLLQRAGFDVSRNCTAVLVRVAPARNAEPLTLLTRAGLEPQRVDIETGESS